jgi:hypothetical protein
MTKDEIFAAWAPESSPWSRWTKPVTFAHIDLAKASQRSAEPVEDPVGLPLADDRTALIVDLPGGESVRMGLVLAERGYQPVVLFNAVPLPASTVAGEPGSIPVAVVDMFPILDALRLGAERLQRLDIPPQAPPVFLLDANRHGNKQGIRLEEFDNRSISFTSDFPSANFLAAHGVSRAILIQKESLEPQPDLAHSLRRWQDGGVRLERMKLMPLTSPEAFQVARPPWYGAMFQRVLSGIGLRHAWGGGFGAWLPDSAGGG